VRTEDFYFDSLQAQEICLFTGVQTSCGYHPDYAVGTGDSFAGREDSVLVINLKKYRFILSQLRPVSIIHTVNVLTVMTTQRMWELRSCTSTPYRRKRFVFSQASRPAVEPTQTIQWVPGTLSPGVKTPWCEAPCSAEGKNAWSYAYTPHILSWRAQGQ